MKIRKRLLSALVAMVMIIGMLPVTSFAAETNDYESSWAKNEINYMKEKGILSGYPDGTFKPTNNMSKAEFYKVTNSLFGFTKKGEVKFDDVKPTDWYYGEVEKGLGANYIPTRKSLNAKENITRGEVTRIIGIVFGIEEDIAAANEFTDNGTLPKELKGVIGGLKKNGYINGYPDGTFRAQGNITRAEVVKMLHSISGEIVNVAGTISKDVKTNLVVNTADVLLKDMTIAGNLYLTEGIGEGDVTLDNVVVKGELNIKGGGANSIIIKNSKINTVSVDKESGLIRVVFENTTVEEVKTVKEVKIELTNGTVIKVVELDGKVEVVVEKGAAIVSIDAVSKEIIIDSKGTIESIKTTEAIKINGTTVKANSEYKVEEGKATDTKPTPTPTPPPSSGGSSGGSGGGGGGGGSVTPDPGPDPVIKVVSVEASNGIINNGFIGVDENGEPIFGEVEGDILDIKLSNVPKVKPTAMSVKITRTINSVNDESFIWRGGISGWDSQSKVLNIYGIEQVEAKNEGQTVVYSVAYGNTESIKSNGLVVEAETGEPKIQIGFTDSLIYFEESGGEIHYPNKTIELNPGDATLTYKSSNTEVVTIDGTKGDMIGVGVGTATITVTATKEGYKTTTTTFNVSVRTEIIGDVDIINVTAENGMVIVEMSKSKHISRKYFTVTQAVYENGSHIETLEVIEVSISGVDEIYELRIPMLGEEYVGKSIITSVSIYDKEPMVAEPFIVKEDPAKEPNKVMIGDTITDNGLSVTIEKIQYNDNDFRPNDSDSTSIYSKGFGVYYKIENNTEETYKKPRIRFKLASSEFENELNSIGYSHHPVKASMYIYPGETLVGFYQYTFERDININEIEVFMLDSNNPALQNFGTWLIK